MSPADVAASTVLAEVVAEYGDWLTDRACLDDLQRAHSWLLVEEASDGRVWLSSHATCDAAGVYWSTQECREDWRPVALVDLLSGHRHEPVVTLTFPTVA